MRTIKFILLLAGLFVFLGVPVLAQEATPAPDAPAQQTPNEQGPSMIRIANFLTDAGVIDVYVDGQLAIADVNSNTVSGWFEMPSDDASIAIAPAGTTFDEAFLGPFDVTASRPVTIAVTGSGDAQNFDWMILRESASRPQGPTGPNQQGNVQISLVNSFEDLGSVNVQMTLVQPFVGNAGDQGQPGQNDNQDVQTFDAGSFFDLGPSSFGDDTSFFNVPAGLYNISLVPTPTFATGSDVGTNDNQANANANDNLSSVGMNDNQAANDNQGSPVSPSFSFQDQRLNVTANWPSFSNVALNANSDYLFAITQTPDGLPWLIIQPGDPSNMVIAQPQAGFTNQIGLDNTNDNLSITGANDTQTNVGTNDNQSTGGSSDQTGPTYP
jgi:hypothetical protein